MPLDPDTQYYQMGDGNAGAQPSAAPSPTGVENPTGINPLLDLQSAGAQAAPAGGQNLAALFQLIGQLTAPKDKAKEPAPLVPMKPTANPQMIPTVDPGMSAGPQGMSAGPQGMTSPQGMVPGYPMAPPPGQSPDRMMPGANGQPPAPSNPQSPNNGGAPPLSMPQMPHHNNSWLQALGALSALAGGPGGHIASAVMANQKQGDTDRYNQQVQAYQQQQHDTQTTFENTNQTAAAGANLTEGLSRLDPASQEARVRGLMGSPGILAAYGYTPDSAKAQFFDNTGAFVPVTAADKPVNEASVARAQTQARNSMSHMTLDGQQSYHDGFASDHDAWQQQTGLPYEGFVPSATAKDANDTANTSIKLSASQNNQLKTLTGLTLPAQTTMKLLYKNDPAAFARKYGVPLEGWEPGMTQANATAAASAANRETDALRTDATHLKIARLNTATKIGIDNENNRVAMRGQDIRAEMDGKQINARVAMFNQRYGEGNGGKSEKQYQSLLKDQMTIQKRMTVLSTPQKDAFGDPALSLRDQGRVDANGNHIENAEPTAAYNEYMYLAKQEQYTQQQMDQMLPATTQAPAAPVAPLAPLAPMPVGVRGNQARTLGMPQGVSPLAPQSYPAYPTYSSPAYPAYTSHGSRGAISLALPGFNSGGPRLTPAQIHGMTTQQLLQRLAMRAGKK